MRLNVYSFANVIYRYLFFIDYSLCMYENTDVNNFERQMPAQVLRFQAALCSYRWHHLPLIQHRQQSHPMGASATCFSTACCRLVWGLAKVASEFGDDDCYLELATYPHTTVDGSIFESTFVLQELGDCQPGEVLSSHLTVPGAQLCPGTQWLISSPNTGTENQSPTGPFQPGPGCLYLPHGSLAAGWCGLCSMVGFPVSLDQSSCDLQGAPGALPSLAFIPFLRCGGEFL